MASGCLLCGGSRILVNGQPCPECTKELMNTVPICAGIPSQYQGVKFDKSFLPAKMQEKYGTYMETLLKDIVSNISTYQKNILICARPNCGKTVWSYNLYALLYSKGIKIPALIDVGQIMELTKQYTEEAINELNIIYNARAAVFKVPTNMTPWMFDMMYTIIERRVRFGGFTIFLYGGNYKDMERQDTYGKMKYIKGTGSYNTIEVKSFYEKEEKTDEEF